MEDTNLTRKLADERALLTLRIQVRLMGTGVMYLAKGISAPPGYLRDRPRPPELRGANYDEQYDAVTLVSDIAAPHQNKIALIAPPLMNFAPLLERLRVGGISASNGRLIERDRVTEVWLDIKPEDKVIVGDWIAPISLEGADMNDVFRNKRVLYTLSKNNDIEWISRWIRFNLVNHKADAVLIYDNASEIYSPADLEQVLRSRFPSIEVCIVSWPYKYGPQGSRQGNWDSDFAQHGAFHSARFRFLQKAKSVLNTDIDELVVSPNGESVFEAAELSDQGFLTFPGRWVLPEDKQSDNHVHSIYLEKDAPACPLKWCVVPSRCKLEWQWRTHTLTTRAKQPDHGFEYRHFRLVSNHWKGNRQALSGEIGMKDALLVRAFSKLPGVN